jgi:adenosylhomocysteine nucleosidase
MLLIAAAMREELEYALALCQDREKFSESGVSYWKARRGEKDYYFFKFGIGPRKSAEKMELILNTLSPSKIFLIGYGGALDPGLKLGDLVGVKSALACSLEESRQPLDHLRLDRQYELQGGEAIADFARSLGMRAHLGNTLTSAYVLGDPEHKRLLYQKHRASMVDMETAAVAAVSISRKIPLCCLRVVSDEAEDAFLAPFSYNPSAKMASRAVKIVGAGIQSYKEWKSHSRIAGESLSRFLAGYL